MPTPVTPDHQDNRQGAFLEILRGGREMISVDPQVMVASAAGAELESPEDSSV